MDMAYIKKIKIFLITLLCPIILLGSSQDLEVLKDILKLNPHLDQKNPRQLGTQIWNDNRLTYLNLSSENIMVLPDNLGDLEDLVYLNLDFNQLTTVPESVCDLINLEELHLSDNTLIYLPEDIGYLASLSIRLLASLYILFITI